MQTFTVQTFALDDGSGRPLEPAGAEAHIEIHTTASCIRPPLPPVTDGFEWPMNDDTRPDVPARVYRAGLVIKWPDGLRDRDDFTLWIDGGC